MRVACARAPIAADCSGRSAALAGFSALLGLRERLDALALCRGEEFMQESLSGLTRSA